MEGIHLTKNRHEIKLVLNTAEVLKRMRLSRKITRKVAGNSVGVSAKTIERFENGRANFTDSRVKFLIRRYNYAQQEFNDLLVGKISLPDVSVRSIYPKKQKPDCERRKYQKLITKEARIIKSMRKMKGLTQPKAAELCGYHRSVVDHLENGRVNLTDERIRHMVHSYGYSMTDFEFMKNQKVIRHEAIEQCQQILDQIDNEKLQAVQALLQNFR